MARQQRHNLGVDWFLPGAKRRFATTTQATNDLIVALSEDGLTVAEARDQIRFDAEGKAVLAHMADRGLAEVPLASLVA